VGIELVLNGVPRTFEVPGDSSLLTLLREHAGLTSPKDGCAPQGQCGACLVLVDGHPKTACAVPARAAAGKRILTLEGVDPDERRIYAEAFARTAGVQCGFCIPGIVLRMKSVLDANPDPTDAEIRKKLDPHLCRCTGYVKIVEAFHVAARLRRGEVFPPTDPSGRVGTSLDRYQAEELALGLRPFVADLSFPGLLHGALTLSPHARARVVRIDTSKAEAHPGVLAVVTAKNVPGKRRYGLIVDDWPGFVAEGEETRYVGDVLAAVAAVDERTARAAAARVDVTYEVLTPVTDPETALDPATPHVAPGGNLLSRTEVRAGDADAALAASAHVAEGTWRTQRIEHLFLEPEACVAVPGDATGDAPRAKVTLYTQGQGIFDDRRQVSSFLGLPPDDVHVVLVPNGGAFGGKEDLSVQAQTALLALTTDRPVKLVLSREESIRIHPKRHPITLRYRVGCDAEGRLTAVRARLLGDSGAYASCGMKVLERAAGHATGPYRVANVDIEAVAVTTNNPPCGAMRGFGANQAHFAIEGALDMLAEKCGLDGWEIRWRNALEAGDSWAWGQRFDSVGLKQTLLAVKDAYHGSPGRAGIACGLKNTGLGNGAKEWGRARLVVEDDGTVTLFNGFTEMGQGLLTVLIQFACEVTGLPARTFRARVDTRFPMEVGQTTGSRATFYGGRAVIDAARKLRADLDAGETLATLRGRTYVGEVLQDDTTKLGHEPPPGKAMKLHAAFSFATQVVILDDAGRVKKVVAAHDVGRAVNPKLCEGQIEGAVHMGLGYALREELRCVDGMPSSFRIRDMGVLRAQDMPEVEVILVEDPQPDGPFGAKGVGEIGLVPTAPAVASALYAFDGIRRFTLPMKDSPAARAPR